MVKEISENVYAWKVIEKPDGPGPIEFEIAHGTKAFKASLEDGPEATMGEWLSRKFGYAVPLWPAPTSAAPEPTIREKEHASRPCTVTGYTPPPCL
jgi:hypothetical protein